MFGALSLFLVLVAFAALKADDLWWNLDAGITGLPTPGDYHSWARPGSPLECLLTAKKARLSVDFGERGLCFSGDSTLNIAVSDTTTITGDGLEELDPYARPTFLRRAGLPRAVGLSHILDFIGASQRPEANFRWQEPWHEMRMLSCNWYRSRVTTLEFECEGVPQKPIYFETDCPRFWNGILRQPVYFRAHGISDVARSIVARSLRKTNSLLPRPTTVHAR
jgi:hypothetical protein